MTKPEDVVQYWFGPFGAGFPANNGEMWWKKDPAVDAEIKARFGAACEASARGELADWATTALGRQAHILLIDQMARNMHRDSGQMYAQDDLALRVALQGIAEGDPWGRRYRELQFFLMPLMHAEDVGIQRLCCRMFGRALAEASDADLTAAAGGVSYAEKHRVIVERFGRFPHRNALLGRQSTPEEAVFLEEPGSSF